MSDAEQSVQNDEESNNDSTADLLHEVDLLRDIIKCMVEFPEQVGVTENVDRNDTFLTISVNVIDRGKIIGKQGSSIRSLQRIFGSIGAVENRKIFVQLDNDGSAEHNPNQQRHFDPGGPRPNNQQREYQNRDYYPQRDFGNRDAPRDFGGPPRGRQNGGGGVRRPRYRS